MKFLSELNKLHTGEFYNPGDPEITSRQEEHGDKLHEFNYFKPSEKVK